jgi:hypothetical protein
MTDRLFRLVPWAPLLLPCLTLGSKLVPLPGGVKPAFALSDALASLGMPELLVLWLVGGLIVAIHLGASRALSDAEKRAWRRYLIVGGCPAPLIYLCSANRHLPHKP